MPRSSLVLGVIALTTLVLGMVSGIALGPRISEPLGDVRGLLGERIGLFDVNLICSKEVYKNETLDIDSLEGLDVRVGSGRVIIDEGEPRIIVYTLKGVFCNLNPGKPRWDARLDDGSLAIGLDEGVLELYIPADKLELFRLEVESGIIDVDLGGLSNLRNADIQVDSGIVDVRLAGLRSLSDYNVSVESGVASIDLEFEESRGGDVYVYVSSGQLNLDIEGSVNACIASSKVSSGFASIDLPSKCGAGDVRVHVDVSSGIVSIK